MSSVAVRSVIGPRTDCVEILLARPTYCFCLSARTPSTSRAMRSFLSSWTTRSASRTASSMSPSASTDRKARSSSSRLRGSRAQRRAVIGRGRRGVALRAGVARGEIAARRRNAARVPAPTARRLACGGSARRRWADKRGRQQQRRRRQARRQPGAGTRSKQSRVASLHGRAEARSPPSRAQNGLFARRPQGADRATGISRNTLRTAVWQHRGRTAGTGFTYSDSSARRRPPAAPR